MHKQDLMHIVGTAWVGDPQKENLFNDWYNQEHLPVLVNMPGILKAERYKKVAGDQSGAPYLATYTYASAQDFDNFQNSPASKLVRRDMEHSFQQDRDFKRIWNAPYFHVSSYEKDITDDSDNNAERITLIVGISCGDPRRDGEISEWHRSRHVPMLLMFPGLLKANRYQRISADDEYPGYLGIFEFKDLKTFKEYENSPELKVAGADRLAVWPDDGGVFIRKWRVVYQRLIQWNK